MASKSLNNLARSNGDLNKIPKAGSQYLEQGKKFTQFQQSELNLFAAQFATFDKNGDGVISKDELSRVIKDLNEKVSQDDLARKIKEVDLDGNERIDFTEFLHVIAKIREGQVGAEKGFGSIYQKQARLVKIQGATDSTQHSVDEQEYEQFCIHISNALKGDPDVKDRMPINGLDMSELYEKCKDGLVLSKLINDSVPDTIDVRVLNKKSASKELNAFQKTENQNVVVNSAKAIGCSVVNIGAEDLIDGREILVLGLVWQIIKIGLFAKVSLTEHPELFRLLQDGETLDDLFKLPVDQILLRWFNYHLKKAGHSRKVANFTSDIKDSECYTVLLNQLVPEECSRAPLEEKDLSARAEKMLQNADKIGCRKYATPKAIVGGNQKLNVAFVANLFNNHPGLEPLSETEKAALDDWLFNSQGDREARAFALWLNSLGVDPFVNNLYEDLKNGLILLQAFDKIHPGCVEWKRVNKGANMGRFKAIENTNYVVELGLRYKYSLVGIQGADLTDGSRTLTLSIVWQLMRDNIMVILKSVSGEGSTVSEEQMVAWANSKAKNGKMTGFQDKSLKSSLFFLDLLNGIKPGIVDQSLVSDKEADYEKNARYTISITRKLGGTVFLLPADIIEGKAKMILTLVGTLMSIDKKLAAAGQ